MCYNILARFQYMCYVNCFSRMLPILLVHLILLGIILILIGAVTSTVIRILMLIWMVVTLVNAIHIVVVRLWPVCCGSHASMVVLKNTSTTTPRLIIISINIFEMTRHLLELLMTTTTVDGRDVVRIRILLLLYMLLHLV